MSDTPRTDIAWEHSKTRCQPDQWMRNKCEELERDFNRANAIIAAALAYVEEFKEFPMEEQLIAILEGRVPAVNKNEE